MSAFSHICKKNGRCSNVDLADAVGLSQSPSLARTKKLEQAGYITGYGADIALDKLGHHILVMTEITLQQHRPADFKRFEERIANYQEIAESPCKVRALKKRPRKHKTAVYWPKLEIWCSKFKPSLKSLAFDLNRETCSQFP